MPYDIRLGDVRLPVTPSKIDIKINNQNRTLTLINDGEINVLKQQGLTEISLTALFPNAEYPFAVYEDGFKPASEFVSHLETLKNQKGRDGKPLPFLFIIARSTPDGQFLQGLSMEASIQDYSLTEEAGNGFDVMADIKLKQYKRYGVKTVKITNDAAGAVMTVEEARPAANAPQNAEHTVREDESLQYIAQLELGDCGRAEEIYNLNRETMDRQNNEFGGLRHTVYAGQVLRLPGDSDKHFEVKQ